MRFDNQDAAVSEADLAGVESHLGFRLPPALRTQYLNANGGIPFPYVYEDEHLDTVVSAFLPVVSARGKRTAVDTYDHLVRAKQIVAAFFFPFAVDGGGDFFFVDCSSEDGVVHFYRSDAPLGEGPLLALGVSISEFWSRLHDE